MRIIPVLDLKGGEVVRAERGQRDLYRPIVTPVSQSPDVVSVARGLRGLHDFRTFYIADLDAIEGRGPNRAALRRLRAMPDAPELWVDAGFADGGTLAAILDGAGIWPILGTESQTDAGLLRRFRNHPRLILSLDFFAEGFRGPASMLQEPQYWPQQVIVMTLARVGAGAGPDFARLRDIKAMAGDRSVIAAGGVRDEADLRSLVALGIEGALVATSLHDGTLTRAQLAALSR
ncbi:MAG TPA: HisA/HisF-related TIM barrel protein [Rhizobiaceae bacterium]|nr:HisA/HisF-related TIM barrel protein [Rhizobiaceae bacterium]